MSSKLAVFLAIGNRVTLQIRLSAFNEKPLAVWNLDSRLDKTFLVKQGGQFSFDDWVDQIVIPVLKDVKTTWLNHVRIYEVEVYKELDDAQIYYYLCYTKRRHPLARLLALLSANERWTWEYDIEQTAAVMQWFATLEE